MQREVMLNFADIKNNNNKFYSIKLHDDNRIEIEYGRVGGISTTLFKTGGEKVFEKQMKAKIKKGYVPVDIAKVEEIEDQEDTTDYSKDTIMLMLKYLLSLSKNYVKHNVNIPLGSLTESQIKKGKESLNKIRAALNSGKKDFDYVGESNEFYRSIPFPFNSASGRNNRDVLIIDTMDKVTDKDDLLDVIASILPEKNARPTDEIYNVRQGLHNDMEVLCNSSSEYSDIIDGIVNSLGHNHSHNFHINEIIKINDGVDHKPFNKKNIKTKMLYHGTRSENVLSILKSGLKTSPPSNVHITGKMFGNGIYLADSSTKSMNYCSGFGSTRTSKYYLLICEAATGKEMKTQNAQPGLTAAPKGYDSVKGEKGSRLIHNEYIVYDNSQVRIKYIVEFTK